MAMTQLATAQSTDPASDSRIDPQVRTFLAEINKDSAPFWELPQPKPQEILTALQNQTPVDMSGVTTVETTITQDGRKVKLYIMTPQNVSGKPGVLFFIHGGVWIVGNFQNHQRLLRDLVVGSGQIGVFVGIHAASGSEISDANGRKLCGTEMGCRACRRFRRRRQPYRHRGQLGRRKHDRSLDAHGKGQEWSKDRFTGAY